MLIQILDILSRRVPGQSVKNALETAREIESLARETSPMSPVRSNHSDEIPLSLAMIRATAWAERFFSPSDVQNYKIRTIKELRNSWGLSLKQAKDIADNVRGSSSVSYWD